MAHSKYEGGARITSFRLPLKQFDEAKKGIETFLKRYAVNRNLKNFKSPVLPLELATPGEAFDSAVEAMFAKNEKSKMLDLMALEKKRKKGIPEGFSYGEFASGDGNEGGILPVHSLEKKEYSEKKPTITKKLPPELKEKLKELDPNIIIPESGIKPPEWAKKHKTVIKNTTEIHYPCGCIKDDGLFRRDGKCKLKIEDHKP